jgi:hypothetical protein
VLVPTPLFDFRYFITPVVLARAHEAIADPTQDTAGRRALTLSVLAQAAVNVGVLYLFVARPFVAPDGSVGRFMW